MNRLFCVAIVAIASGFATHAQENKDPSGGRSASKVKATAVGTKPDADGKQTVTITLEIEKEFYLYANPVNNEILEGIEMKVKVTAKEKVKYDVKYPAGKTVGTKKNDKYDIYESIVKVEAHVVRNKDDTGPLTIHIAIQGSDGRI
jgi:hypothetical protein